MIEINVLENKDVILSADDCVTYIENALNQKDKTILCNPKLITLIIPRIYNSIKIHEIYFVNNISILCRDKELLKIKLLGK